MQRPQPSLNDSYIFPKIDLVDHRWRSNGMFYVVNGDIFDIMVSCYGFLAKSIIGFLDICDFVTVDTAIR